MMRKAATSVVAIWLATASCSGSVEGDGEPGDEPGPGPTAGTGSPGTAGAGATPGRVGSGGAGGALVIPVPPAPACTTTDVGDTPLRRLTREQYANSVRDLLGVARVATDGISPDENVGPFASNTVAAATGLAAQQYMESAETLARAAVTKLDALVGCDRAAMGDAVCAAQFIDRFGLRAFRRPLTADEKKRYVGGYGAQAAIGGFAAGIRSVVTTMLQSPHFLYHIEFAGAPTAQPFGPLGQYELASRLSYFLWNTLPDAPLLAAAGAGALTDPKNLRAQVDRMLKDDKARDGVASFHLQWLDVDALDAVSKDTKVYPTWNSALRAALRAETLGFVDHVVRRGDGKLGTLLTAPFSLIDGPLFDLYKAARPATPDATKPTMLDPQQRAGLLTHGSFLAAHAHANQSSPVSRGVLVRKNFLCQDLPDPPDDVNNTAPDPKPGLTTRERFTEHTKSPTCAGCHALIDDVGFGFEGYDGIGAFRTSDGGKPVDARGKLIATDVDGSFEGAVELSRRLAGSRQVHECVTRQWFRFALGRNEGAADTCALQKLSHQLAASGLDLRELLASLAASDAFRLRKVSAK